MSGFLQRLAAGVLHSQSAIHPSVGTIWSAAGTTGTSDAAEPIETQSELLVSPSPRRADALAPAAARPIRQQPAQPPMQPEGSDADAQPRPAAQLFTQQPAKPQAPPETQPSTQRPPRPQETAGETIVFRPLVSLPQLNIFYATHDPNETAEKREPILPARLHRTPRDPSRDGPPLPLTESPRMSAPALRTRAPAADRNVSTEQPDSIEIHIGRIEVLAAPPRPEQPPAPGPARKSLDLGEYLRGERRSR